jgi:hypothetical protein
MTVRHRLANRRAHETAAIGALGLFQWKPAEASIVPAPAKWMLPRSDADLSRKVAAKAPADLFDRLSTSHRPEET